MGNKQGRKKLSLPQTHDDHQHVYVLGNVEMACAMLRALVKHFRPSDDVDVVLSDPNFFSYQSDSSTVDVHVLLDDKSFQQSMKSQALHLVTVLWVEDSLYAEKQRAFLEQTYHDVTCLPMALWNLVLSYYSCESTLDAVYRAYNHCRTLNVPLIRFMHNTELASHEALPTLHPYLNRGDATTMHVDFETDKFIEQWQLVRNLVVYKMMDSVDIGEFGTHQHTPGIELLLNNGSNKYSITKLQIQKLVEVVTSQKGRQLVWDANFSQYHSVLDIIHCITLIRYVDEQTSSQPERDSSVSMCSSARPQRDFKVNLSVAALCALIGTQSYDYIEKIFGRVDEIILRRTEAVADDPQCINFHLDCNHRTMQIALNGDDEYDGGRLTYLTHSNVVCPIRPAGSCTIHDDTVVHGVSALFSGVRYGLFFLQTCR